jgi:hypothetical protein
MPRTTTLHVPEQVISSWQFFLRASVRRHRRILELWHTGSSIVPRIRRPRRKAQADRQKPGLAWIDSTDSSADRPPLSGPQRINTQKLTRPRTRRVNHRWRGQSDAGRCRNADGVIQRPKFMTVALSELDGVSRKRYSLPMWNPLTTLPVIREFGVRPGLMSWYVANLD